MPPKPLILAFDTAVAHCAAVVVQGGETLAARVEPMTKGQAERLFPLIEDTLKDAGLALSDLHGIAVGTGPGNFTGIRISVSAARGLALSLGIPAIGVSRPEAMAFGQQGTITTVIDARQDRLYIQNFEDSDPIDDVRLTPCADFKPANLTLCDADVAQDVTRLSTQTCLVNGAQIAAARLSREQPRPAPFSVRAPDAALPSDPPPTILP